LPRPPASPDEKTVKKEPGIGILFLALAVLSVRTGSSQQIVVGGSLSKTFSNADLVGGAGTDFENQWENSADELYLDIDGESSSWTISVSKTNGPWNPHLSVSIKRIDNGLENNPTLAGGMSYLPLFDMSQIFYTGTGSASQVRHRFRLSGLSVQVPPGNYYTTVMFTIM
jgi:hypothetical protein